MGRDGGRVQRQQGIEPVAHPVPKRGATVAKAQPALLHPVAVLDLQPARRLLEHQLLPQRILREQRPGVHVPVIDGGVAPAAREHHERRGQVVAHSRFPLVIQILPKDRVGVHLGLRVAPPPVPGAAWPLDPYPGPTASRLPRTARRLGRSGRGQPGNARRFVRK